MNFTSSLTLFSDSDPDCYVQKPIFPDVVILMGKLILIKLLSIYQCCLIRFIHWNATILSPTGIYQKLISSIIKFNIQILKIIKIIMRKDIAGLSLHSFFFGTLSCSSVVMDGIITNWPRFLCCSLIVLFYLLFFMTDCLFSIL